jgi:hypothetical protein
MRTQHTNYTHDPHKNPPTQHTTPNHKDPVEPRAEVRVGVGAIVVGSLKVGRLKDETRSGEEEEEEEEEERRGRPGRLHRWLRKVV